MFLALQLLKGPNTHRHIQITISRTDTYGTVNVDNHKINYCNYCQIDSMCSDRKQHTDLESVSTGVHMHTDRQIDTMI